MKRVICTICLLVFIGGCNQGCWINPPNKTSTQIQQDIAECKYEATKASYTPMGAFDSPFSSAMQEATQYNKVFKVCLEAKGYRWTTNCK